MNAEILTTDDFQIVGQAGMGDGEIIVRAIGRFRQLVDKRIIGIADDLAVPVVFHHDDENVIQLWHTLGNGALLRGRRGGEGHGSETQQCCLSQHEHHLSRFCSSVLGSWFSLRDTGPATRSSDTLVVRRCDFVTAGLKLGEYELCSTIFRIDGLLGRWANRVKTKTHGQNTEHQSRSAGEDQSS